MLKSSQVLPFRGLRYNRQTVPDLSRVICPPYDIISLEQQQLYHDRDPHNAIHLDYGLTRPDDSDTGNRYTRAAASLKQWLAGRILVPDERPAFYFCREEYVSPDGTPALREGFITAVRLSDFSEGRILPHEHTASGPKEDRLRLIQATEANLSPIYLLYSEPGNESALMAAGVADAPDIDIRDDAGTRHTVWVIDDPETTAALSAALSRQTLLIADGHHRYETMLAYRDLRRAAGQPDGEHPYDYTMAYLSNMDVDGKSILPIHRFVSGLAPDTVDNLAEMLGKDFELHEVPGSGREQQERMVAMMRELGGRRNAFGLFRAGDGACLVLTGRRERPMIGAGSGGSAAYRALDVAVLDRLILAGALGIGPGGANAGAAVRFVERTEAALDELDRCDCQLALFVNPTSMQEIKAVAQAGEKMPRKSTYFYPKPPTGLVFRSFSY